MTTVVHNETSANFASEVVPRFEAVLELARRLGVAEAVEEHLGFADAADVVRHRLVQFRLYPEGLRIAAFYISALSSGYLTVGAIPFPLKQIGVKVEIDAFEHPSASEVYVEPVSMADARAWFVNGDSLESTPETIGYGVVLGDAPRAVEHYHWVSAKVDFHRRIELRTNLVSGRTDRYYRYRTGDGVDNIPRHNEMSLWDQARLAHMLRAVESAPKNEAIDPILIYAHKPDRAGVDHIALYLTTATVNSRREDPAQCS